MDKRMSYGDFVLSWAGIQTMVLTIGMALVITYVTSGLNPILGLVIQICGTLIFHIFIAYGAIHLHNEQVKKNAQDRQKEK